MTRPSLTAIAALTLAAALAGPALAATKQAAPAKAAAPAALSADQLATAERVLTGKIDCELNQSVDIAATDKPGHFKLSFKGKSYDLVPEATASGAVRLEDKKAGVVWIQIANKSMLMNAKIGQRMVDGCVHEKQR
ncbi:MAG TPA: hypothetical protein PKC59_14580 [Burkholderiaceae bacterium]|nr:hypothetical protein [Burkholderiaceae bacterium]HMX10790.1 hypothetical protein [Burkholderiaceae bacterium]HMZ00724.1 hypothetical protein [Burkholderiaceae bacterium]HNB45614.1 hypothetical protein [Burkholderiaceae bacterium]HNG81124.1 hypothetical protein [Burkholderiaceae bacterium]